MRRSNLVIRFEIKGEIASPAKRDRKDSSSYFLVNLSERSE